MWIFNEVRGGLCCCLEWGGNRRRRIQVWGRRIELQWKETGLRFRPFLALRRASSVTNISQLSIAKFHVNTKHLLFIINCHKNQGANLIFCFFLKMQWFSWKLPKCRWSTCRYTEKKKISNYLNKINYIYTYIWPILYRLGLCKPFVFFFLMFHSFWLVESCLFIREGEFSNEPQRNHSPCKKGILYMYVGIV